MKTVQFTANNNLCCSCGVCGTVCPKEDITYSRQKGMYIPSVDAQKCINCGLCLRVCSGLGTEYPEGISPLDAILGRYIEINNAWSKNAAIRHASASGGIVTTMVEKLLNTHCYDYAFCVDSYCYDTQITTEKYTSNDLISGIEYTSIPKSRYLPVSQAKTAAFIKDNQERSAIIIGTSCAIQSLRKLVKLYKKDCTKYLFIGLFCDKVFNYNIYQYYQDVFALSKKVCNMHFKNKDSGGWPGNTKLIYSDGASSYVDKKERSAAKDYFMPERCLYCIDKLNVQADISLGDNYTEQDSSHLGSNTVFIRTQAGAKAWSLCLDRIEWNPVTADKVSQAQFLEGRITNAYFAALKEKSIKKQQDEDIYLNRGITLRERPNDYHAAWTRNLRRLESGLLYLVDPSLLTRRRKIDAILHNKKHPLTLLIRIKDSVFRKFIH